MKVWGRRSCGSPGVFFWSTLQKLCKVVFKDPDPFLSSSIKRQQLIYSRKGSSYPAVESDNWPAINRHVVIRDYCTFPFYVCRTKPFCLRSPWLQIPPTLCRPFKLVWLSKSQHTPQWNVSEKSLHRSFHCFNQNNGSMKFDPYALETLSQMNQLTEELNGNPNKNQVAH